MKLLRFLWTFRVLFKSIFIWNLTLFALGLRYFWRCCCCCCYCHSLLNLPSLTFHHMKIRLASFHPCVPLLYLWFVAFDAIQLCRVIWILKIYLFISILFRIFHSTAAFLLILLILFLWIFGALRWSWCWCSHPCSRWSFSFFPHGFLNHPNNWFDSFVGLFSFYWFSAFLKLLCSYFGRRLW